MSTLTITVTAQQAKAELKRRGKLPNTTKNLGNKKLREKAGPAMQLGAAELFEIAEIDQPVRKGRAKAPKATTSSTPSTFDRSNPLGLNDTQKAIRQALLEECHFGVETVRYKTGAKKGQVKSGYDSAKYRRLMDEAGVPRIVRKSETVDVETVQRGTKQLVTVGDDAVSEAFAQERGIS